jgi:hypothetical protein
LLSAFFANHAAAEQKAGLVQERLAESISDNQTLIGGNRIHQECRKQDYREWTPHIDSPST